MKYSAIILFLSFPFVFLAQQVNNVNQVDQTLKEVKHIEDSIFQHDILGVEIVCTKFYAEEHAWISKEFEPINIALQNVSGVYNIELRDNNRILFVVHSERLSFDELKQFIVPYKQDIEVLRSVPYSE